MDKVYVVLADWNESTSLFGVYVSFESAKNAVNRWVDNADGRWTSENCFESNHGGTYRIVTRIVETVT